MAGWMSARAATVVDSVPPTLDTREEEPTPAARTVVGISSPVEIAWVWTVVYISTYLCTCRGWQSTLWL